MLPMIDPEASRQTAHIFLDAASTQVRDGSATDDERDDMVALALERLRDVGAIELEQVDGGLTLDIRRLQTGVLAVIVALLRGWSSCAGVDEDELIVEVRRIIDEHLTEEAAD